MTVWIASPIELPKPGTCRVIGTRVRLCEFIEADLLLRFSSWVEAETYLDRMADSEMLPGGHIEVYVDGIGWVLADTNPESE